MVSEARNVPVSESVQQKEEEVKARLCMAIAGMVCTALSVSGQVITDLKTGYWLGSTPAVQERGQRPARARFRRRTHCRGALR